MKRRLWWVDVSILLLVALLVGGFYYRANLSPTAQVRQAAHRFWLAAVAGDETTIAGMLAPEADFTVQAVVTAYEGKCYGGRCGGDRPDVNWMKEPGTTGAEVIVNVILLDPSASYTPLPRSLAMKRLDGAWKVVRQGTGFSF